MDIDTRCPVCWGLDEDGRHCFLKCKFVKQCWRALNLEDARQVLGLGGPSSAKQITEHVLSMPEEKKLLIIIGLLWAWWDARNKANARNQRRSTEEVIFKARSILLHEKEASADEFQPRASNRTQRWVPPPPEMLEN